jgi:anti-anti-sigma regulatory factor
MLKIQRETEDRQYVVLQLSGRIQSEETAELRRLIRAEHKRVVLDLKEVRLVDRAAVRFLVQCQAEGVELINPSAYIQEWISREAAASVHTQFSE